MLTVTIRLPAKAKRTTRLVIDLMLIPLPQILTTPVFGSAARSLATRLGLRLSDDLLPPAEIPDSVHSQKTYLSASWITRGLTLVFTIWPKFGAEMLGSAG